MPKRIRIGNQTAKSARHWLDPFRYAMRMRFDAFEWFEDHDGDRGFCFPRLVDKQREQLKRIAQRRDVAYSVHAALHTDLLNAEDHGMRSALAFAHQIGAGVVVVHTPGHEGNGIDAGAIAAGLGHWAKVAGKQRITVAMENTVATSPGLLNDVFECLGRMRGYKRAMGYAGVCLDIGHANLHEAYRHDYVGYLNALSEQAVVRHVHAHENYGDADSHLPLFAGPAGANPAGVEMLVERLVERGFAGSVIMEQWPEDAGMLGYARDRLRWLVEGAWSPTTASAARGERRGAGRDRLS